MQSGSLRAIWHPLLTILMFTRKANCVSRWFPTFSRVCKIGQGGKEPTWKDGKSEKRLEQTARAFATSPNSNIIRKVLGRSNCLGVCANLSVFCLQIMETIEHYRWKVLCRCPGLLQSLSPWDFCHFVLHNVDTASSSYRPVDSHSFPPFILLQRQPSEINFLFLIASKYVFQS